MWPLLLISSGFGFGFVIGCFRGRSDIRRLDKADSWMIGKHQGTKKFSCRVSVGGRMASTDESETIPRAIGEAFDNLGK